MTSFVAHGLSTRYRNVGTRINHSGTVIVARGTQETFKRCDDSRARFSSGRSI